MKGGGWGGAPPLRQNKFTSWRGKDLMRGAPGEECGAPGEGGGSCPGSRAPDEVGGSEVGLGGDVLG
jgi:hypothetical protein